MKIGMRREISKMNRIKSNKDNTKYGERKNEHN